MPVRQPGAAAESISGLTLEDIINSFGYLRYGMPTNEKERLAETGQLPGAPQPPNYASPEGRTQDPAAYDERSNRYAAGYLFAQQYPNAAPVIQPYVDMLKGSDLPWLGGESPEVQSWARAGVNAGSQPRTIGEMVQIPPPPSPPRK